MKVQARLLPAALAVTMICFLPGCEKAFDYLKDHSGENSRLCSVQKLEYSSGGVQYGEISITYNAAGNPTSMLTTSGYAGHEQYHFRYDKYGRLSDYILTYYEGLGGVVYWEEYTYPNKKTVIDSAYEFTGNVNDPVHPTDFNVHGNRVTVYSLDASGRIIKATEPSRDGSSPPSVTNFAYDAHGNLIRPGVTYDNKVNVYQTNKVWMFVYNDYSVNNPLIPEFSSAVIRITSYNAAGLPLVMKSASSGGYLFNHSFSNLQIVYDCDRSKAPSKWWLK